MTIYDARTKRLLTEDEERAYWIADSIRELYASRREISGDAIRFGQGLAPNVIATLRDISHMIASLQCELRDLNVKECDCCGQWRADCHLVAHPSFGDTLACEACRPA